MPEFHFDAHSCAWFSIPLDRIDRIAILFAEERYFKLSVGHVRHSHFRREKTDELARQWKWNKYRFHTEEISAGHSTYAHRINMNRRQEERHFQVYLEQCSETQATFSKSAKSVWVLWNTPYRFFGFAKRVFVVFSDVLSNSKRGFSTSVLCSRDAATYKFLRFGVRHISSVCYYDHFLLRFFYDIIFLDC